MGSSCSTCSMQGADLKPGSELAPLAQESAEQMGRKEMPPMEESQPQDIEELAEELEREHGIQASLPQEVEEHLQVLQSGSPYPARQDAAEQLGNVGISSARIVRGLITASETDEHPDVRRAAAGSLRAPVHQQYLQQHPDVVRSTKRAVQQRPNRGRTGPSTAGHQSRKC